MYFFIADTHFGHANAIKLSGRPFADLEEMNETLIQRWNNRVKGNDTVCILGDMFFRCENPKQILRRLKGKKRLIVGNHDGSWMSKVDLSKYFLSVDQLLETTDGKRALVLCHYPMLTWKHSRRSFMIHGHIHADTSADFFPLIANRENVLNAGVEINNYQPVSFEELIENNKLFKKNWIEQDK